MLSGEVTLDGELYIPGRPINEINHVIKSPNMKLKDKLDLQFWMYDLMWEGVKQFDRLRFIDPLMNSDSVVSNREWGNIKHMHMNNRSPLVYLGYKLVEDDMLHKHLRDRFIGCGFEGVILRDAEGLYQYGKRNMTMIKYKQIHEGKFKIIDVVSEGKKRPEFGIFVCQNDINEETFTCTYAAPFMMKKDILANREAYIGAYANVEFRERSGVKSVPFHAQCVSVQPRL
jgi:ATP-dependent DNA ligase